MERIDGLEKRRWADCSCYASSQRYEPGGPSLPRPRQKRKKAKQEAIYPPHASASPCGPAQTQDAPRRRDRRPPLLPPAATQGAPGLESLNSPLDSSRRWPWSQGLVLLLLLLQLLLLLLLPRYPNPTNPVSWRVATSVGATLRPGRQGHCTCECPASAWILKEI